MQPGYAHNQGHNMGTAGTQDRAAVETADFLVKVYGWMSFGLFITAAVSMFLAMREDLIVSLVRSNMFHALLLGELALVFILSAAIHRMSATTAGIMFFVYSALNGVTISIIFLIYTSASIASTFVLCSATFGAMSVYGYTTKSDLSSVGSFCYMALFGLIFASLFNIFFASPAIYWISTYAGIAIFIGLTAWDTQKIKLMAQGGFGDEELADKASIMGALALYLDFINLFLYLLRLFGNRRRN